jgi:hypothetical protein
MKNLLASTMVVVLVTLALVILPTQVFGTEYSAGYVRNTSVSGYPPFLQFSHTFIAATDTVYMAFSGYNVTSHTDTITYELDFETGGYNGDSVDLSVRWEVSNDGTNWKSYTLGTDSTTWVSTTTAPLTTVTPKFITIPTHGIPHPYQRVKIIGNAGNNIGTFVKVAVHER